ncbi:MAG: hypothetical protein NT047_03760 [Deltaproteobacteria bacterium]|nr:hypothetical protein [Deltaproteobacteria bacterium]
MDNFFSGKTIVAALAAIVLGAIGSGLWEIAIKPLSKRLPRFTLIIFTLGLQKLRDPIYKRISKGKEDNSPLFYFFMIIFIFYSCFIFIDSIFGAIQRDEIRSIDSIFEKFDNYIGTEPKSVNFEKNYMMKFIGLNKYLISRHDYGENLITAIKDAKLVKSRYADGVSFDKFSEEDRNKLSSLREKIEKSNAELKGIMYDVKSRIYIILISSLSVPFFLLFAVFMQQVFINDAILYYQQLLAICKPYIEQEDSDLYNSRISLIGCKDDYMNLINELIGTAQKNKIDPPRFSYL